MSTVGVVIAMAIVGGIGLFIGLFLGIAAIKFRVDVDEREEAVLAALPGNNCGGCGFPGCSGLASAIVRGEAAVGACPVGGEAVGKVIAGIMGVKAEEAVRKTAFVKCQGDFDKTSVDYEYFGVQDCRMLAFVPNGGPKSCNYGCLGGGSCVTACPFDAIHVVKGVAVVDKEACKACGKCVEVCPKSLIELIPYDAQYMVACNSKDKGQQTTKNCTVGCIGCQLCKRNCPSEAVDVVDFNAAIDYEKCIECGVCMEKCPKKTILKRA
ncbi:RnfABCDGE type electron transport complex subunit B [Kineothrix sedimenti]|uniref:Ion-translocating oxidoreductase complex subunit B n=1 Tax=Kineothrix sedimenti TaxID=3123317 RepID=A0ABZ3ET54_9FIRM